MIKLWKVWNGTWTEKRIWQGTDADAVNWRRMGLLVEEYENESN